MLFFCTVKSSKSRTSDGYLRDIVLSESSTIMRRSSRRTRNNCPNNNGDNDDNNPVDVDPIDFYPRCTIPIEAELYSYNTDRRCASIGLIFLSLCVTFLLFGHFYFWGRYEIVFIQPDTIVRKTSGQNGEVADNRESRVKVADNGLQSVDSTNGEQLNGPGLARKKSENSSAAEIAKLQKEIEELKKYVKKWEDIEKEIDRKIKEAMAQSSKQQKTPDVSEEIQNALTIYDADKIGMYDYAAEYAGGSIAGIPSTLPYPSNETYQVLGLLSFPTYSRPEAITEPSTLPGSCFAFYGTEGQIVIKLGEEVVITAVTLEHVPPELVPDQTSAPKEFEVYALTYPDDIPGVKLGSFTYDIDRKPMQTFYFEKASPGKFGYVKLNILSNHGKEDMTCVYRFRVHSVPIEKKK